MLIPLFYFSYLETPLMPLQWLLHLLGQSFFSSNPSNKLHLFSSIYIICFVFIFIFSESYVLSTQFALLWPSSSFIFVWLFSFKFFPKVYYLMIEHTSTLSYHFFHFLKFCLELCSLECNSFISSLFSLW